METETFAVEVVRQVGCVRVWVTGEVDVSSISQLTAVLFDGSAVPPAGQSTLVLNLVGVTFIDTSGLGLLVRCRRRVRQTDTRLVLVVERAGAVVKMLEACHLRHEFEVLETTTVVEGTGAVAPGASGPLTARLAAGGRVADASDERFVPTRLLPEDDEREQRVRAAG